MSDDSESSKTNLSIEERLGIDYNSPEWKAGVLKYNNRVILKHDIESRKLLVVRRLLREGNIGVLDKDNQGQLADCLDHIMSCVPQKKKGRGRPQDDEINTIETMKFLYDGYTKLHVDGGLTIDETLKELANLPNKLGKRLGKKRIEQLITEYKIDKPYHDEKLHNLYRSAKYDLYGRYRVLIGDKDYIDHISSLSDCKMVVIDYPGPEEIKIDENLHRQAIKELSLQFNISESDVEKRINFDEGDSSWD